MNERGTKASDFAGLSTDAIPDSDERTDSYPLFARLSRPRSPTTTTFAVVSDAHVSTEKRGTWKVFHRTRERLRAAVADANEREVDAVVFTGDLTEDGATADFETVDSILDDLEAPCLAVPGNHDVPKAFDDHEVPPLSSFEANYAPSGLPFHERIRGVDLVGLNSAATPDGDLADSHDGLVSADQLSWLERTLPETEAPVVFTHHNLLGLTEETEIHSPIRNADAVADVLAENAVPLLVSGHLHVPTVAETAGVREAVAPSLCSFPQAYLLFEVGPDGTTIRVVPTAGSEGVKEAYEHAKDDSARSDATAEITADRLSSLPLADEGVLASGRSPGPR